MSKLFRMLPAVVAASAGAFLLSAYAADKPAADRPVADRPAAEAGSGQAWEGRISGVEAATRQLTLSDVRMSPAATGTEKDKGASGTDKSSPTNKNAADKGTGTNTGTGAGDKGRAMTFQAAENAKITVDGKAGELSDLKSGMAARVYVRSGVGAGAGADRGTGADKTSATDKGTPGADKDKGVTTGTSARMVTDRIEARSKGASDTGAGKDKESRDR